MTKLSLPLFIKACGGTKKASQQLGIPIGTLRSYLYKEKIPRPKQVEHLIRASNGQLDFNSIYQAIFQQEDSHG